MLEWKSIYSDNISRSDLLLYLPRGGGGEIVLEKKAKDK